HAWLLFDRAELELRQIVGIAPLLAGTKLAVVAERYGQHPSVESVGLLRLALIGAGVASRATLDVHTILPRVAGGLAQRERLERVCLGSEPWLRHPTRVQLSLHRSNAGPPALHEWLV